MTEDVKGFAEAQAKVDRIKMAFGPIVKSWVPKTGEITLNSTEAILQLLDRVEDLEWEFKMLKEWKADINWKLSED